MPIVGFVLAIVVLMVGIGTNLSAMLDIPSFLIVFGFTFGALLMSGADIPLMLRGIKASSLSDQEAGQAARGWKMARIFALAAGGLGTMTGWIIMLANIDDPAALGPGMAISLLTVLYGLLLAFAIALPLQTKLAPQEADGSASGSAVFAIILSVFLAIGSFALLMISLQGAQA